MDSIRKEALIKSSVYLCENLLLEEIIPILRSDWLRQPQVDILQSCLSDYDRTFKLITWLTKRTNKDFDAFCTALIKTDQLHLSEEIYKWLPSGETPVLSQHPAKCSNEMDNSNKVSNQWSSNPGNCCETFAAENTSATKHGGYIVVAGGYSAGECTAGCNAYDINIGVWFALPDLPSCKNGGGLVTHQGRVYYVSGTSSDCCGVTNVLQLSTKDNKWIEGPPLQYIAFSGVNALSLNKGIYVLGGRTHHVEKFTASDGNYVWSKTTSTLQEHFFSGAAVLNGKIYVAGSSWPNPSTFCESFDPSNNLWQSFTPMKQARKSCSMVSLKECLYVIGGSGGCSERYDPVNDQWTNFANLPLQQFFHASATDGSKIYVVGGGTSGDDWPDNCSNLFTCYSPELDIWQEMTSYPISVGVASETFVKDLP